MSMENTVFIIDDDASVRDALGLLLGLHGYRTAFFADAKTFLDVWHADWTGCLIVDIRMPGMDGLTLIERIRELGSKIPVIVITGHGDVASARQAFRAHAIDFLEKPIDEQRLISAIDEAFERLSTDQERLRLIQQHQKRIGTFTAREREVMELVVAGKHNRDIAEQLGISARTVEVHKARILAKADVQNVTQLVRLHIEQAAGTA
jgi:FixJ family two-component response regulator